MNANIRKRIRYHAVVKVDLKAERMDDDLWRSIGDRVVNFLVSDVYGANTLIIQDQMDPIKIMIKSSTTKRMG